VDFFDERVKLKIKTGDTTGSTLNMTGENGS